MYDGDIILVANGPGELSALVRPVAEQLKKKDPDVRITVFLTPCQYASGFEEEFIRKHVKADQIVNANDYKRWLLGSPLPKNVTLKYKGSVLFLGGDLLHATLISKKLGYAAFAYLSGQSVGWVGAFRKFFVPELNGFEKKIPAQKLDVVGDLMAEKMKTDQRDEVQKEWKIDPARMTLAMMPGSRLWEIRHLLPLYEKIGIALKKLQPSIQLMLMVSPFTPVKELEKFREHHIFDMFAPIESISAADLVLTIPGTNTAQIAALGLPMVVVFPLDKPEAIPLEGLAHMITSVPILGYFLKKMIAQMVSAKNKYFSLPNIKSGREIVPEFRGKINAGQVAEKIISMMTQKDYLKLMSDDLLSLMKPSNASEKIAEKLLNADI